MTALFLMSANSVAGNRYDYFSPVFVQLADKVASVHHIKYMAADNYPTTIYYAPGLSIDSGQSIKEILSVIDPYPNPCKGIGCYGRISQYIYLSPYYPVQGDYPKILISVDEILYFYNGNGYTNVVFSGTTLVKVSESISKILELLSPEYDGVEL